jgi:hypothetical protein
MEKTMEEFFMKFPDTATPCTVIDKMIKKAKHIKKHYKKGEEEEMLKHNEELHNMTEVFHKLWTTK